MSFSSWMQRTRSFTRANTRGFIFIALSAIAFFYLTAGIVIAVDPLNLYPWGAAGRLKNAEANSRTNRKFLNLLSTSGFDGLVIGGSTERRFRAEFVEAIFPDVSRAFTLTYPAGRPADQKVVLSTVAEIETLSRVIVSLSWAYMLPGDRAKGSFPFYLYNDSWRDDIKMLTPAVIMDTFHVLMDQPVGDYRVKRGKAPERYEGMILPATIAEQKSNIDIGRSLVFAPTSQTCEDFPAIQYITSLAAAMLERDTRVDVIIPPLSLYSYFEWNVSDDRKEFGTSFFERQMAMRRCAVDALEGYKNTNVHAFDNEDWLTGDLGHYFDSSHIFAESIYKFMLAAIRDKTNTLDKAGFAAYETRLRKRVANYEHYNSRLSE